MPTGVTIVLTQSLVKASEDEGSVEICAALEKGQLGTNLSISLVATDSGNESGIMEYLSSTVSIINNWEVEQLIIIPL